MLVKGQNSVSGVIRSSDGSCCSKKNSLLARLAASEGFFDLNSDFALWPNSLQALVALGGDQADQ